MALPYVELGRYLQHIQEAIYRNLCEKFPESVATAGEIVLEKTPNLEMGEFAYPCFPVAKKLKQNPAQVAATLAQNFSPDPYILQLQAAGPYLNIKLPADVFARSVCETILTCRDRFGSCQIGQGEKVMIEYSSPNTNKPLHIGHVRNNLIGMAIANILEFCGFQAIKANLVNDRGIHICKSMLAYQKWGEKVTPKSSGTKGDHLVGQFYVKFEAALKEEKAQYAVAKGIDLAKFAKDYEKSQKEKIRASKEPAEKQKLQQELREILDAAEKFEEDFLAHSRLYQEAQELLRQWEAGDQQVRSLWKTMNAWVMEGFRESYAILGCKFDKFYFESDTYRLGREHVEAGVTKGVFYQKADGSIWVAADKLRETAPQRFEGIQLKDKLLLRADGTSVYITQDIGTAILKFQDFGMQHSLYVVADEQNLHFKTLFTILELLGFPWAKNCHHLAYGMVTLPHGMGKIKSREGTAVDADDLMGEMKERAQEKIQQGHIRVAPDQVEATALEIALAALKVFILQVSLEKNIQFDPTQTIEFNGDTGPAIQYSYARICSMLRKAISEYNLELGNLSGIEYGLLNSPQEIAVIRQLCDFPETVKTSGSLYNPSQVANYLLSLTKTYARLYTLEPVLKSEPALRNARLILAQSVAQVIKNGMALLGVYVPESM